MDRRGAVRSFGESLITPKENKKAKKEKGEKKMQKDLQLQLHGSGYLIVLENQVPNLGFTNENKATTVTIILPSQAFGAKHYIELENPNGVPWSSAPLEEQVQDGVHFINLPLVNTIIPKRGRYGLQYVGRKGNQEPQVIKSEKKYLDVDQSIDAGISVSESNPDFITWATSQIADIKLQLLALDVVVPNIADRLEALEAAVGQIIYMGVIFYGEETIGERLGAAVGKRAGVNGEPNDFDTLPIYKDIRTYFNENGEKIWACETDFYYKHVKRGVPGDSDFFEAHYISPTRLDDTWGLHIAYLDKDKKNRGRFTLGAFKAGLNEDGTKLVTKPGIPIKNEISLEQARELAIANNAHIAEMRKFNAVNILMLIEFAVRDFQRELFKGVSFTYFIYGGDQYSIQEQGPTNVVREPLEYIEGYAIFDGDHEKIRDYYKIGNAVKIYDDNTFTQIGPDRIITSFEIKTVYDEENAQDVEVVEIGYSGTPFEWTNDGDYYPILIVFDQTTGQCDGLPGSSHERLDQPDGVRHFSYRGLEDIYGLFYEWTDGEALKIYATNVTQNQTTHYAICFDPEFYDESNWNDGANRDMSHFENVALLTEYGRYIESFKEIPEYPGVLIPDSPDGSGSDSTYYADYSGIGVSNNSASPAKTYAYVFYRGGDYYHEFGAGPFYADWLWSDAVSRDRAVRLSYDPS